MAQDESAVKAAQTGKNTKLRATVRYLGLGQLTGNNSTFIRGTMFNDLPRCQRLFMAVFFPLITGIFIYMIAKGFHDGELTLPGKRRSNLWSDHIIKWDEHPIGFCALAFGYAFVAAFTAWSSIGAWKSFLDD
ncbi:MAG TPA: hypothetical protein VL336_02975 [Sphingomicrobium sp.]|nr:hypothetical protein [Sphingomicrobium sp.]